METIKLSPDNPNRCVQNTERDRQYEYDLARHISTEFLGNISIFQRAIDEIEGNGNLVLCQEAILLLEMCERDFQALANFRDMTKVKSVPCEYIFILKIKFVIIHRVL